MKKQWMMGVLAGVIGILGMTIFGQQEGPGTAPPATGPRTTGPAATRVAVTPPAGSQPAKPAEPRTDSSTTFGTLKPAGKADISYTATAGYLPLKDDHDKLRANIFYTAYTYGQSSHEGPTTTSAGVLTTRPEPTAAVGGAGASGRPIMFLFNGGPGAASAWLHLGAAGPRRLDVPENGAAPQAPYKVVENEYSWLSATDLVFVDPVNTGYSRAATPEQAKEFFGVQEDISAMGEFIRLYLTKNNRWSSPVFLAGESYGTTRCAGLSDYLQERVGVSVSGVVLMSTVLNFSVLSAGENNEIPYVLYLPSYAAVAWYHKKAGVGVKTVEEFIKPAEEFATGEYVSALTKGAALSSDERSRIARRVADFTGLSPQYVLESNLRIPPQRFEKELLRSPTGEGSLVIGRFDGRLTGFPTDAPNDSQEYDPSLSGFYPAYTSAFNDYVRRTLRYENDIAYEVLSPRVGPWNWGGTGGQNGYLYVGDNLRDAMTHNAHLRLLVCSGRFDLATPYFATDYQVSHMTMSPEIRKNITQTYYEGGHMMYHVRSALEKLSADVTGFIEASK